MEQWFPTFARRHAADCPGHINCSPGCETDAQFRDRIRNGDPKLRNPMVS